MFWIIFLIVLVVLYISFFVGTVLFVPFFRDHELPKRIPREFDVAVKQLEKGVKTPHEYIVKCKDYLLSQNVGGRLRTLFYIRLALEDDLKSLFDRRGFMHCHHLSVLMRILLVRSSFFSDGDVRVRVSFLNWMPHQYLQARVAGQWYDIDIHEVSLGLPLGKHGFGFSSLGFTR